jgi:hypothetical protein
MQMTDTNPYTVPAWLIFAIGAGVILILAAGVMT